MNHGPSKDGWFDFAAVEDWQIVLYIAALSMIYVVPAVYDRWKKRRSAKKQNDEEIVRDKR